MTDFVGDFTLKLIGEINNPISFWPRPDYQQVAYLVYDELKKKGFVKDELFFEYSGLGGVSSEKIHEEVEHLSDLEDIQMEMKKPIGWKIRPVYGKYYFSYFHFHPLLFPFAIISDIGEIPKILKRKRLGNKRLSHIYELANEDLEKHIGQDGLKEMEILVRKYRSLPIDELWKTSRKIYFENNPEAEIKYKEGLIPFSSLPEEIKKLFKKATT